MLPLVLVMMVVSALVVIPLLSYAVSVLKAEHRGRRHHPRPRGGRGRACASPCSTLMVCSPSATVARADLPAPFRVIDEVDVTTRCELVEEVGPLNVMGFQTPIGSTATQLGATPARRR